MKDIPLLHKVEGFIRNTLHKVQRYTVLLFIILVLGLYGFLVFRIGSLSQVEPDEIAVNEQLKKIKKLKIDQASVNKIQQLEDDNINVQALFKQARENPFNE